MITHQHHKTSYGKTKTRLFRLLSFSAIFIFLGYMVLLNATIQNVVAAEDAQKHISLLHSEIGELEAGYLSLVRENITMEQAHAFGLLESKESPRYVSHKKTSAFLFGDALPLPKTSFVPLPGTTSTLDSNGF